jgi:hypothetical protein
VHEEIFLTAAGRQSTSELGLLPIQPTETKPGDTRRAAWLGMRVAPLPGCMVRARWRTAAHLIPSDCNATSRLT